MTRFVLIFVLALSLAACAPSGPSDQDLTTTPLTGINEAQVAFLAETNTASANFALTQSAATPVPTSTATTPPTAAPSIEPPTLTPTSSEPTLIPVTLNPSIITDLEAPIRIDVPEGWEKFSDALLIPATEGLSVLPYSLYSGPVTGGQGNIVVLWAFENVVPASPTGQITGGLNLYADGLRLLLFTVIEPECQFGYDEEREFMVGGRQGAGTYFVAEDCPDNLPSLQGWFSALTIDNLNFSFYAYTEPQEALMGPAQAQLQAILDSVEFDLSLLPTPAPTELPVTILTVTPSNTPDEPSSTPAPPTATQTPSAAPASPTSVTFATSTPAP